MTPMPTPAANRAVSAPAFAIRMALSTLKKNGEHQTAKSRINIPHSMKMPRSRRNTSTETVRGTSCPVGTGAGASAPASVTSGLTSELVVIVSCPPSRLPAGR